jgi:hypothetical protein
VPFGAALFIPDVRGRPEHLLPPAHSKTAYELDQLEAPETVGAPLLAADPGAPPGGNPGFFSLGVSPLPSLPSPPLVSPEEPVVALPVERIANVGAIEEASGPDEEPELDTP